MYFIIKPHPEVFTKSESVRKRFTKILECNIRNILKRRLPNVAVYNKRTHIEVSIKQYDIKVIDYLSKIPGINYFLEVVKFNFDNLDEISEISNKFYNEAIENIKMNTRRFAKRQITWFNKDKEIKWFDFKYTKSISEYVASQMKWPTH